MILLGLLLLCLAARLLLARKALGAVAPRAASGKTADIDTPNAQRQSAAAPSNTDQTISAHIPNVRLRATAAALKRAASPASSATTPADPKAAAVRVRFGADNAIHARNLTQQPEQPARR